MKRIILLDPLGGEGGFLRHRHFLRDWSGTFILGYIAFPPLDLMYAASYLRRFGHNVKIVEASVKHIFRKELVRIVKTDSPDFVLIPSTYFTLAEDKYLARLIKSSSPGTKVIFSGPLVTYDPSLALSDGLVDFVALGELELPLLNILSGNLNENVAFIKDGKVLSTERRLLDLEDLPIPARDLVDNHVYKYAIINRKNPATAMTISRGCPHGKCKFCHSRLYSLGTVRYRDISSITDEINEIVFKYRIKEVFFRDQVFTGNKEIVYKICEHIISMGIDIFWRAATRVDMVDKELLRLMYKAGCYQVSFGLEHFSQKVLDANNKGINVEQSRQAVKLAKEAGIEVLGLFMYGMIGDDGVSASKLFRFMLDLGVDYANINNYCMLPGSEFYEEYKRNPGLLRRNLALNKALFAYLGFYLRPGYLWKQLKKVRTLKDLKFLARCGFDALLSYL